MSIAPDQLKAARRLLGWSQLDLALNAGTSLNSVSFVEAGKRPLGDRVRKKLQATLEAAGIEFIYPTGEGPSVRLRKTAT